jgi:hypothetical protein
MKLNIREELAKNKDLGLLLKDIGKAYAEVLQIDENKASDLITAKFNMHIDNVIGKFEKNTTDENVNNANIKEDVEIEEYLENKPVIKG